MHAVGPYSNPLILLLRVVGSCVRYTTDRFVLSNLIRMDLIKKIFICLVLVSGTQSFSMPAGGSLVPVPGTRLWIRELPNFEFNGTFPLLTEKKGKTNISFYESSVPIEELLETYRDSTYDDDWEVMKEVRLEDPGMPHGSIVTMHKTIGLVNRQGFTNETFISGDSLESFRISLSYIDSTHSVNKDLLKQIIATLQWRKDIDGDPMEKCGFRLTNMRDYCAVSRGPVAVEYTPYGLAVDSTMSIPSYSVRLIYSRWTDPSEQEKKDVFEEVLKIIHPLIHIEKVLEHSQINLDGIDGYEAVTSGVNWSTDSTVIVYVTVLFHPSSFIGFVGISSGKRQADDIAAFKEMTRSFERVKFTGQDSLGCYRLLETKHYEMAEKCYGAALRKDSLSVPAKLGKARALHYQKKYDEAVALYTELIGSRQSLDTAYIGRAESLMGMDRQLEAIHDYDNAIRLSDKNLRYIVARAEAKSKFGNTQGAAMDYESAIALSPTTIEYYLSYAEEMINVSQPFDAVHMLMKAVDVDSTDGKIYAMLGEAEYEMDKYSEALAWYDHAEALGARSVKMFLHRSEIKLHFDDVTGALQDAKKAYQFDKKNSDALCRVGKLQLFLGHMDDAMTSLTKASGLEHSHSNPQYYRGIVLFLTGKNKEAARDFRVSGLDYDERVLLYLAEKDGYTEAAARKNLMLYKESLETKAKVNLQNITTKYGESVAKHAAQQMQDPFLAINYALQSISAEAFIEGITTNEPGNTETWKRKIKPIAIGNAYFIAGMVESRSGLKIGSRKYFEQCMASLLPEDDSYQLSKLILSDTWQ
jgi:tetratricopeptide (TPR) repeat protein